MKDLGITRFIMECLDHHNWKVMWTHYFNTDGDANFNIKLDKKYYSLFTPANINSKKLNVHYIFAVVCQGNNSSNDHVKINQCKDKYICSDFRNVLPKVGIVRRGYWDICNRCMGRRTRRVASCISNQRYFRIEE